MADLNARQLAELVGPGRLGFIATNGLHDNVVIEGAQEDEYRLRIKEGWRVGGVGEHLHTGVGQQVVLLGLIRERRRQPVRDRAVGIPHPHHVVADMRMPDKMPADHTLIVEVAAKGAALQEAKLARGGRLA